jgi:hypothetical protein
MIYNNTSEGSGKKKKREEKVRIEIRKSPSFYICRINIQTPTDHGF